MKVRFSNILATIVFAAMFAFQTSAQDPTIDKGTGWLYFSDVPAYSVDPSFGSELAVNTADRTAWIWNRTSSTWERWYNFDQGSGAPSTYTTGNPKTYLDTSTGTWYYYTGSAWEAVNAWSTTEIQDLVGAMFTGGSHTGINANYNTSTHTIDLIVTGGGGIAVDSLVELGDVSITSPVDSAVFIWDATLGKWRDDVSLSALLSSGGGLTSVSTDATISGDGTSGNPISIAQQGATSGQVLKWNGTTWAPASDNYEANTDAQTLSASTVSNNITITISGGNSITFSRDDGDSDATNERNTALTLSGTTLQLTDSGGTLSADLSTLVDDADADPLNEIQTVDLFTFTAGLDLQLSLSSDATTNSVSLSSLEESQAIIDTASAIRAAIPVSISDFDDVDTAGVTDGQILKWSATAGAFVMASDNTASGGSGETNVGSNAGTGAQVYKTKTDTTLIFRTITATNRATATQGTDEITIDVQPQDIDLLSYSDATKQLSISLTDVGTTAVSLSALDESQALVDTATAIEARRVKQLSDLSDVSSTAPTSGQVLKWNGTDWAPATDDTGGGGGTVTTDATLTGDGSAGSPLGIAQQAATSGQVLKWNGTTWAPAADADTDAQTLSLTTSSTNRTITISGGNSITLDVADNDNSATNEIQDISTNGSAGNISIASGSTLTLNVDDADASTTNELQTIATNGNVGNISISSGNSITIDVGDSDPTNEYNTSLALSGDVLQLIDGGGTLSQDLSGLRAPKARIAILTYGNSLTMGLEDSTDIGYTLLNNLYSYNNDLWAWEQAIPDTNLTNTGYTNIPRRTIGMTAGSGLTTERLPRHGNPGYWAAYYLAQRYPNDTVYLHQVGKGGIYTDSLVNSFYKDSLKIELDSAAADGVNYYDVVIFPMTHGETADAYQTDVQNFYRWLKDTAGVIDEKTLFLIQGQGSQPEDNGIASSFEEYKPNWRFIRGMDKLAIFDGVHQTASAHKVAGELAFNIIQSGGAQPVRDSLMNISFGPYDIAHTGSQNNFMVLPNNPGDLIDSLDNTVIIGVGAGITLDNYIRNSTVVVSNEQSFNMNNISEVVAFGTHILEGNSAVRDSITLIGRRLSATKSDVVAVGHRSTISKVGGYIFGNDRTTTRNNQMLLGDANTDYIVLGPVEFDMSFTPPGAAEENYVFAWNNASGMFTLEPQSGSGGSISSFNWGDGTTTTTITDGETIQVAGGVNGIDAILAGNDVTINLDFSELFDATSVATTFEFAGIDISTGIEQRVADDEVLTWINANHIVTTDATITGIGSTSSALGIAQQGATSGQVLKWNGSTWAPAADDTGGGGGDNLGNHIMTQDLNASNFDINNVDTIWFDMSGIGGSAIIGRTTSNTILEFGFGGKEIEIGDGSVKFFGQYYLPALDGTNGQLLTTNGAGQLSFADAKWLTYRGPQNPGVTSDAASYVEFWRDTIAAGSFTSNHKEWYNAEMFARVVNTLNTEFLDYRIRINDGTTTQTVGESINQQRYQSGADSTGPMELSVTTDPDAANSIVTSFRYSSIGGTAIAGGIATVTDITGQIIVILECRWDNDEGDYIDIISDWSAVRK